MSKKKTTKSKAAKATKPSDPDIVPLKEAMKKPEKIAKSAKDATPKKLSALDGAAKILADKREPMSCGDIVTTLIDSGMWKTSGKTPAATLYSAILREINVKGSESRFKKTDRGRFALSGKGA